MIAPIFGPVDFMQERNKVAGQFTDNPFGAYLGGLMASHDKPFSKYPPAVGGTDGRYPGLSTDDIKRFVHPSLDPLLHIRDRPFGMQAGEPSSGDFRLAGLVGYEDWTGPKEHGPYPDIFKSKNINQKGLKSLMEEMREYRRRGVL